MCDLLQLYTKYQHTDAQFVSRKEKPTLYLHQFGEATCRSCHRLRCCWVATDDGDVDVAKVEFLNEGAACLECVTWTPTKTVHGAVLWGLVRESPCPNCGRVMDYHGDFEVYPSGYLACKECKDWAYGAEAPFDRLWRFK